MTKHEQLLKQRAEIDAELEAMDNQLWPKGTAGISIDSIGFERVAFFIRYEAPFAIVSYNPGLKDEYRSGSFTPLDCAILGREYTHDGSSECPVHPGSWVWVDGFDIDDEEGGIAKSFDWQIIKSYWIIKRGGATTPARLPIKEEQKCVF